MKDLGRLVSIVTPAFNVAEYIEETIASVQNQTYTQWEWIIADDGSTDATLTLAQAAAARDPRIKVLQVEGLHGLAARGRNLALRHAQGGLIAFLDADDRWAPEKLERQATYLEAHPEADGVCCWWTHFGDPKRVTNTHSAMKTSPVCDREDFMQGTAFQTSTLLFRRRCHDELGPMDEDERLRSVEDSDYFARMVDRYTIHRLCENLSFYRLHKTSYTASVLDERNSRGWHLFEVLLEKGFYKESDLPRKRSFLYYEQAINNLFYLDRPYRRYLWRSLLAGRPPLKALIILKLWFLPRSLLKPLLKALQRLVSGGGAAPSTR